MKIKFYSFVVLFVFPALMKAQPSFNFYLNGSAPLNQFKKDGYTNGIGGSMEFITPALYKKKLLDIRLGLGFEFFSYGRSRKVGDLVFNTPNNDKGSVRFINNMNAFYLGPKFTFNTGSVSPYVDVFGAIRAFYTRRISEFDKVVEGYEPMTTDKLFQKGLFHYGASAGLLINITQNTLFDVRVSYSRGGGVNFVDLSSVDRHPDFESNIKYSVKHSPVSEILIFRIGVVFRIPDCENCTGTDNSSDDDTDNYQYDYNYNNNSTPDLKPAEVKPVPLPTPNH